MRRDFADYTADELNAMDYVDLLRLRARAYRAQVAEMEIPERLTAWAALMTKRYGPEVKVWKQHLPWLEALMVARYGEDPTQWPPAFSEADVDRAEAWAKGRTHHGQPGGVPFGVAYLDQGDRGFVVTGLLVTFLLSTVGKVLALLGLVSLASALTNFLENEIIDWFWRGRSYTPPVAFHFALFTAAPGETGGGTEVSGGSYARVSVDQAFDEFEGTGGETTNVDSAGTGGATQNVNAITFPAPSANWGSISHMAVFDASSGGNMLVYGALVAAKTVNNGDPAPSFPTGAFDFAIG